MALRPMLVSTKKPAPGNREKAMQPNAILLDIVLKQHIKELIDDASRDRLASQSRRARRESRRARRGRRRLT
jgi:hypothetical protein